jgi:hypothetical protein
LIITLKFIMRLEVLLGMAKLSAHVAPLLVVALAAAVSACGDEAEVVQQTETEQQQSQPEGERPPPREGPDGCYIPTQRSCDCAIVEADCSEDVGVWTMGCASCAAP